ncbi:hypothetical protein [Novosphingobium decolorationis]|uniref:hypothetical protein n=1 Tax=Novosphingobium decolorationis TaxID=2698673 RepID=UPI001BCEB6B4|nr:hypothetical protein [Novosphingobium decolorationis]
MARCERSKSQIMQGLWVCYELGEKREGFFVEFGATNGLKNSNTWLLEHELSGIAAFSDGDHFADRRRRVTR